MTKKNVWHNRICGKTGREGPGGAARGPLNGCRSQRAAVRRLAWAVDRTAWPPVRQPLKGQDSKAQRMPERKGVVGCNAFDREGGRIAPPQPTLLGSRECLAARRRTIDRQTVASICSGRFPPATLFSVTYGQKTFLALLTSWSPNLLLNLDAGKGAHLAAAQPMPFPKGGKAAGPLLLPPPSEGPRPANKTHFKKPNHGGAGVSGWVGGGGRASMLSSESCPRDTRLLMEVSSPPPWREGRRAGPLIVASLSSTRGINTVTVGGGGGRAGGAEEGQRAQGALSPGAGGRGKIGNDRDGSSLTSLFLEMDRINSRADHVTSLWDETCSSTRGMELKVST